MSALRWSPRALPKVRRGMIEGYQDSTADNIEQIRQANVRALRAAGLWWTPASMIDGILAEGGRPVEDGYVFWDAVPEPAGIIAFESPFGEIEWESPMTGVTVAATVDGLRWSQHGEEFDAFLLTRFLGVDRRALGSDASLRAPLFPADAWTFPLHAGFPVLEGVSMFEMVYRVLRKAASTVEADVHRVRAPRTGADAIERPRPNDDVRIVTLRKVLYPQREPVGEHRPLSPEIGFWVGAGTGGFRRTQRYGPGNSLTKEIWVAPFVKGNKDNVKPPRETVNVVRR